MTYVSLNNHKVKEIYMKIDLKNPSKIKLKNAVEFNISFNEDQSLCKATLKHKIEAISTPEEFNIIVECCGLFTCEKEIETDDDKNFAHIQAYDQMFPYMQNTIAQLTMNAGLPPLMIERHDITQEINQSN